MFWMMVEKKRARWYSVSVDTLQMLGASLLVLAVVVASVWGFLWWRSHRLDDRAAAVIADANNLIDHLHRADAKSMFEKEYAEALGFYQEARERFEEEQYQQALDRGWDSLGLLRKMKRSLDDREASGTARFVTVRGDVQFRRSGGDWQRAQKGVALEAGDSVRTGASGSAEIVFRDSTYFNVRPNSQVVLSQSSSLLGGGEQSVEMAYGWVDLSTSSRNASKVTTPGAEAEVAKDSEALVTYEQTSEKGRFVAHRGAMQVASEGGVTRRLGELQQVVQTGEELSEPQPLPPPPALTQPADNYEINVDRTEQVVLEWQPVPEARAYALQVSESLLFVDNVIDVTERIKTRATLGIRGEGSFLWRVAAIGTNGAQSPWSTPRKIRINSLSGRDDRDDRTPPEVDITSLTSYGNLYIVEGQTEPGARIEVNGEQVKVEADGAFTKTVQFDRDGWRSIEVLARDAWGNEYVESRPVFVEGT